MSFILTAVLVLGLTGLVLGLVLYAVSRKFKVEVDPRVGQITELLPGANCGGCGFPGCSAFAEACVKSDSMDGLTKERRNSLCLIYYKCLPIPKEQFRPLWGI